MDLQVVLPGPPLPLPQGQAHASLPPPDTLPGAYHLSLQHSGLGLREGSVHRECGTARFGPARWLGGLSTM